MPKKANILGVRAIYKLTGNDQMNAAIINTLFEDNTEMIAVQAGRNNIRNVVREASNSDLLE